MNLLFVFCEGAHDVAFCRLIFKELLEIKKVSMKFSEYPSPLDKLFLTNVSKYVQEDLQLEMAKKFFLPDWTLRDENNIILLCNSGGINNTEPVKEFLKSFIHLNERVSVFREKDKPYITSAQYLFLYDADELTVDARIDWWKKQFEQIDTIEKWKIGEIEKMIYGGIANDKAVFVWSSGNAGTLEDVLLPLFEASMKDVTEKASAFVSTSFNWSIKNIADRARQKKAIITAVGQKKKPGNSMSVILDQGGLLSKKSLEDSAVVMLFVSLIKRMLK